MRLTRPLLLLHCRIVKDATTVNAFMRKVGPSLTGLVDVSA